MSHDPIPLPEETILADRWAIRSVLGRGGFGITYLAEDLVSRKAVAIKELAPEGLRRTGLLGLETSSIGPSAWQRLRHQFLREAKLLQNLTIPQAPKYVAVLQEHGTAYCVMEYVEGAMTLERVLMSTGRLAAEDVFDILMPLLDGLEALHAEGVLHRDVKPSNILIKPNGSPMLIDFGSAREWHADLTHSHTVQYTPGYAPIEQMTQRAKRGPGTDIYGLCASAYTLLAGEPPTNAVARAAGEPLVAIRGIRPDTPARLASAIEAGLAINLEDRPASAPALRELLKKPEESAADDADLSELDEKLSRLKVFRFEPNACPCCGDVLDYPKPLRHGVCPVCRKGKIEPRRIEPKLCPSCRVGVLKKVQPDGPLAFCPTDPLLRVHAEKGKFPWSKPAAYVAENGWRAEIKDDKALLADGTEVAWLDLEKRAGRPADVDECDVCHAQFDTLEDGRRQRMTDDPLNDGWTVLFPDEWARVAAGLNPDSGNAACSCCGADWHAEDRTLTLLADGVEDPYGFADENLGRLMTEHDIKHLGVGKLSGNPGPVCHACGTEFDTEGESLALIRSTNATLTAMKGEVKSLQDWHRAAQGLPEAGQESDLDDRVLAALSAGYSRGDLSFSDRNTELIWKGQGKLVDTDKRVKVVFTDEYLQVMAGLKKWEYDLDQLISSEGKGDFLILDFRDQDGQLRLEIEPVTLEAQLSSGPQKVTLEAEDLAARLQRLKARATAGG
jgi:serine/threonine protein kinase